VLVELKMIHGDAWYCRELHRYLYSHNLQNSCLIGDLFVDLKQKLKVFGFLYLNRDFGIIFRSERGQDFLKCQN